MTLMDFPCSQFFSLQDSSPLGIRARHFRAISAGQMSRWFLSSAARRPPRTSPPAPPSGNTNTLKDTLGGSLIPGRANVAPVLAGGSGGCGCSVSG